MTDRVTIYDVAQHAGVSTATVSYYLNGRFDKMSSSTKQRIAHTIKEIHYVPNAQARALAHKKSGVIAVLICDIANSWGGEVLQGMETAAKRYGYQMIVCNTEFDVQSERLCVEKMLSLGVDGFVIQPTGHTRALQDRLDDFNKPVVYYDYSPFDLGGNWLKTNLYDAFYNAVSECIERDYDDCVIFAADCGETRTRIERVQGIEDALSARDIPYRIVPITHDSPSPEELSHYVTYELNPAHRTLLVCPHQWALPRVYEAMRPHLALIPDRVGILGLNSVDWTSLVEPSITTIVEPIREEGELALEALAAQLEHRDQPDTRRILECKTRWLGSTRAY